MADAVTGSGRGKRYSTGVVRFARAYYLDHHSIDQTRDQILLRFGHRPSTNTLALWLRGMTRSNVNSQIVRWKRKTRKAVSDMARMRAEGRTQKDVAAAIGVHEITVRKWEKRMEATP